MRVTVFTRIWVLFVCFFFTGIPLLLSFFGTIDGVFRHIDGDLLYLTVLQCRLARQLELPIGRQRLFDPSDGATDRTFRTVVIDADVFHRAVFAVVLKSDEQFVADREVGRFAASFVQFVVGGLQDAQHFLEDGFRRSDNSFELGVRQFECSFKSFHDFTLDFLQRMGYNSRRIAFFGTPGKTKNGTEKVMQQV